MVAVLPPHPRNTGQQQQQQHVHIPYRNSVMTSILRDSLGGNCRTVFVVTLNSEADHLEESISTCRFSHRCSQLSMDVLVNEEVDVEELVGMRRFQKGREADGGGRGRE